MESPNGGASGSPPEAPEIPARPSGIRGFLRGPRLVDHGGFRFVIIIFVLVIVVFGVAFYAFTATLQAPAAVPIRFDPAYMVAMNGTFNVSGDGNQSWPAAGFLVNLSINNVGSVAVPLAPSGQNASLLVGTPSHKDTYHVVWLDKDHDGAVSTGDVFWVTGDGVGLPPLSYIQVSLTWKSAAWTAIEYFVTSSAIV